MPTGIPTMNTIGMRMISPGMGRNRMITRIRTRQCIMRTRITRMPTINIGTDRRT